MKNILGFIFTFLIVFSSCRKHEHQPILDAIELAESNMSMDLTEKLKSYNDSVPNYDLDYGEYLNDKILNLNNQELADYFKRNGIEKRQNAENVLLMTLYRKLTGKPLKISEQLYAFEQMRTRDSLNRIQNQVRAINYYKNYGVGDTIIYRVAVDYDSNSTIGYHNPELKGNNWIFNDHLDLLIKCLIIDKKHSKNDGREFHLEVLAKNKSKVKYFYSDLNISDTLTIDLRHVIVEDYDFSRIGL